MSEKELRTWKHPREAKSRVDLKQIEWTRRTLDEAPDKRTAATKVSGHGQGGKGH